MINRIKVVFFAGIICVVLMGRVVCAADYVDRVVAVVNDDVITLSEVDKAGKTYFDRIKEKAPANEQAMALEKARKEVLNGLIDKKLVSQKAAELSMTVDDSEIDSAIAQILARNNATPQDFRKELAMMNMSEQDYRNDLRDQILQSKLIAYQVRSRIVVVEDEIKEYYQKEYTVGNGESGYEILQMGFSWNTQNPGDGTEEEARKKAEEIRARVLAGESFMELAKSYSSLPSGADGGSIGLLKKDDMAAYMRDTILAMHPGEISPIVKAGNTFQFFKLLSVREGDVIIKAPYESVKDEIRDVLYRQKMEEQYAEWVKSLREKAYIEVIL
jgi:peptidyl-prolyl cis-trans isomerase SurA